MSIHHPKFQDPAWCAVFNAATTEAEAAGFEPTGFRTITFASALADLVIANSDPVQARIAADRLASAAFLARLRATETPPAEIPDPD